MGRLVGIQVALLLGIACLSSSAQTTPPPPLPTQIKKTVIFINTACVHDFSQDLPNLTRERLQQMPVDQQTQIARRISDDVAKLRSAKVGVGKLTEGDLNYLDENAKQPAIEPLQVPDHILRMLDILKRMTSFTDAEGLRVDGRSGGRRSQG